MGDFIVIAALVLVFACILISIFKNKKKSCGGGCSHCEKRNLCHPEIKEKE